MTAHKSLRHSRAANFVVSCRVWRVHQIFYACPCYLRRPNQKMKALEWQQHFPYYKSMGFFPATCNSAVRVVRAGQISTNRSMLLSEGIKKIQSRKKALEWQQHFPYYRSMGFFPATCNSAVRVVRAGQISTNRSMVIIRRNKEDSVKKEGARVATAFSLL